MIKNISAYKTIRTLLTICSLLLLCTALTACGKTGNPRPREASRSFVWQSAEAVPVKNCIAIHAVMSGVYTNLDEVILEVSPTMDGQDCPTCPFIPQSQIRVRSLGESFDSNKGELKFNYCPQVPAPAFRLRLVGVNVFDTSRHAVSQEMFVQMP